MGEDTVKEDTFTTTELEHAREYFQRPGGPGDASLYEHFSKVISALLDKRPENAIGIVEDISKVCRVFKDPGVEEEDEQMKAKIMSTALLSERLFQRDVDREAGELEPEDEAESALPNLLDLNFFFEQAAVGLSKEEMYKILLALKLLVDSKPLQTVRFWGKIFGLESNYYIAEVDYREGALEEEEEEEAQDETEEEENKEKEEEKEEGEENEEDEIPKPDWKEPVEIPKEEYRSGTNKYIYYATTTLGGAWVKLPRVTPAEIAVARQIKKFFTGKLDAPIVSYPPFPGNEANYLRAQIARITASTNISPAGYYVFEEEEEEEEEEVRETYVINPEFEGINPRELMDPAVNSWVHHCMNILPQGRCTWFNPVSKSETEFEDDEEDVEEEEMEQPQPETGPPLLSSVNEDDDVNGMPAWTPYLSSNVLQQYAVACMRSNRWPGAYAFARDIKFENLYVGWGMKYNAVNYTPATMPAVMEEYPLAQEIIEIDDPSVEDEKAAKAAMEQSEETRENDEDMGDEDDDE